MTLTRRERTLAAMLQRWHQLATPEPGQWGGRGSNGLLGANHSPDCTWAEHGRSCDCWHASYQELERCLDTMRKLGRQKAVPYTVEVGRELETRTMPMCTARWQLLAHYRGDGGYERSVPVYVTKVVARWDYALNRRVHEKQRVEVGRRLEHVPPHGVSSDKAEGALRFLAELYRGEPQLPQDIATLERQAA